MYIAYRIETYDGIDYMQPVGVFRNKKDMNDFKSISPSNLNFEKVPMVDMRKVYPIRYIDYEYYKDGSCGYSFEKLKKLSPKLLLKKEIDELKNSDKNGFRANSLFIQIDATDLLNNI